MVADGSTPLRVRVTALDRYGVPTRQPTLTVNPNLEPYAPDAAPSETGYQIRLEDGVGVLELRPQTVPNELRLEVALPGNRTQTYTLPVRPDDRRFGVGVLTATLGLDGNFDAADDLTWTARGYYEGPIGDGKLFAAADKDGLPNDRDPFQRYPLAGDAAVHSVPLQGIDPIAAVYDHPAFRASYQRTTLPISVLPLGESLTAATLETKANPKVSAFAAYVPSDQVRCQGEKAYIPDGLRILHLSSNSRDVCVNHDSKGVRVSRGTDSLELVVRDRNTDVELRREHLNRFVDYSIDYDTGIVTFNRDIQPLDADMNNVRIEAVYRVEDANSNREWAYGAQVTTEGENWKAGVAAAQMPQSTGNQLTVGARAQYDNHDNLQADARAAYAEGFQASVDVQGRTRPDDRATLRVRYQDTAYKGLGRFEPGFNVNGRYQARLNERFGAEVEADYRDNFKGEELGYVRGLVDFRQAPFTVGAGLRYGFGDKEGFSIVGRAAYNAAPVILGLEHEQAFSGNVGSVTRLRGSYQLNDNTSLTAQDEYHWDKNEHRAVVGATTRLGGTNFSVGYELPTADGDGNRARFGVGTTLVLNDRTTLGLHGTSLYKVDTRVLDTAAGADLRYKADNYVATVGGDVGYNTRNNQFRAVMRGGVSGSITDELTLTADALAEFGAKGNGQRFTLGYGYRGAQVSSLGYARYTGGSLAGANPNLTTGISAEYRQPNWSVRAGNETRWLINDSGSFAGQAFLGGNYYLNDYFGVGAWGRAFYLPGVSDATRLGYGVEANVRALPGTWLTAGYNFAGFDGLSSGYTYTKPGAYLRLDVTLDEQLHQQREAER